MIKKFSTFLIAGLMSVATLSAQETPVLKWATVQDGPLDELVKAMEVSKEGNIYMLNEFKSKGAEETEANRSTEYFELDLSGKTSTSVAKLTGADGVNDTNGASNATLIKTDANGKHIWHINTVQGDFSGGGSIAATSDDGVVMALKMRNSRNKDYNILANFADMDGVNTLVEWKNNANVNIYQPILVKVSKDGKIEWVKHFEVSYPKFSEKVATDAINIGQVITDENDNIYITGSFRTSVNFGEKANFTKARNVPANWNCDTQGTSPQDLFVVKLDKDGNATWGTKLEGEAIVAEKAENIAYAADQNKLMVSGYINGNGTTAVKMGSSSIIPSAKKNLFMMSVNAETGAIEWGKIIEAKANNKDTKPQIKPVGLNICENNVYFCGSFQADICEGENVLLSNENGKLNAYILKVDLTNGNILGATKIDNKANAKDILEVQNVFERNENIIATGYGLFSNSYIYTFDKALTAESMNSFVIKTSGFSVSCCSVLPNNNFIVNGMSGNKKATFPEIPDWELTFGKKGCIFTGHDISKLSGVEANLAKDIDFKVFGGVNEVIVETKEACRVNAYNIIGSLVASQNVEKGRTAIALEKGIYIVNGVKIIVK